MFWLTFTARKSCQQVQEVCLEISLSPQATSPLSSLRGLFFDQRFGLFATVNQQVAAQAAS